MPSGSAPLISRDGRRVFVSAGKAPDERTGRDVRHREQEGHRIGQGPGQQPAGRLAGSRRPSRTGSTSTTPGTRARTGIVPAGTIHRFPVDKPEARELFWDRTSSHVYLMFSADGTRACFDPSWGNIGQLKLAFTRGRQGGSGEIRIQEVRRRLLPIDGAGQLLPPVPAGWRPPRDHDARRGRRQSSGRSRCPRCPGVKDKGRNTWLTRWSTHPRYITLVAPGRQRRPDLDRALRRGLHQDRGVGAGDAEGPQCWQSQHGWSRGEARSPAMKPRCGTGPGRAWTGARWAAAAGGAQAPEWPAAPGAVFALRNANIATPVVAFDDQGPGLMAFNLGRGGGPSSAASTNWSATAAPSTPRTPAHGSAIRWPKSGAFTLEATLTPAEVSPQTPGRRARLRR